jgi:hypothetical protein
MSRGKGQTAEIENTPDPDFRRRPTTGDGKACGCPAAKEA